jgi:hypothetical protein
MSQAIGKIATFYPKRGSVVNCVAIPGVKRLVGTIIAVAKAPPPTGWQRPDFLVTIRGQSGRTIEVSLIENYVTTHPTWLEALDHAS